jgi:hypothetical protein
MYQEQATHMQTHECEDMHKLTENTCGMVETTCATASAAQCRGLWNPKYFHCVAKQVVTVWYARAPGITLMFLESMNWYDYTVTYTGARAVLCVARITH